MNDFFIGMKDAEKGITKDIILLDNSIEDGVGVYEHSVKDGDGNWTTELCCKDFGSCALCNQDNYATFVVKLSVLDLTPYVYPAGHKKAGQTIRASKKMLSIKPRQRPHWQEIATKCIEQNKTMRGMFITMKRNAADKNSASIGEPQLIDIEFPLGDGRVIKTSSLFDFISEADLVATFGHDEVKGEQGKILKSKNSDITPFNYEKVFPAPDPEAIRKKHGGGEVLGSAAQVAKEWSKPAPPAGGSALGAARSRLRTAATQPPAETQVVEPHQAAIEHSKEKAVDVEFTAPSDAVDTTDDIPFGN